MTGEDTETSERHRRGCPGSEGEGNVLPQPWKAPNSSGLRLCGEEWPLTPPVREAASTDPKDGPHPTGRELRFGH